MGKNWKIEVRNDCKICGKIIPPEKKKKQGGWRTYCSDKCRNRRNYLKKRSKYKPGEYAKEYREYLSKRREGSEKELIPCEICGLKFRQVGSHVHQVHGLSAREYRKKYGFDVKRGQLPEDLRKLYAQQVFENKTVENLKKGKKYWFKPGDTRAGKYERSQETLERIETLTLYQKQKRFNNKAFVELTLEERKKYFNKEINKIKRLAKIYEE